MTVDYKILFTSRDATTTFTKHFFTVLLKTFTIKDACFISNDSIPKPCLKLLTIQIHNKIVFLPTLSDDGDVDSKLECPLDLMISESTPYKILL